MSQLLDVTCRTSTYTEGENFYSRLICADEPKVTMKILMSEISKFHSC